MLIKRRTGIPVLPNVFDEFFRDWSTTNFSDTDATLPAVNIKENDDEFTVEVAAPGMEKKDLNINFENDVLTISSERTVENEGLEENYTRKEYNYQAFKRSFSLPKDIVDSDKIEATYKNGELKIAIPKREEVKPKPARLIEVV